MVRMTTKKRRIGFWSGISKPAEERELARTSFVNSTAALSPDGKHLAMILRPEEKLRVLEVMDFPGGSPKEILRFKFSGDHYIDLAWSPDSRFIYFSQSSDDGVNWDLWRVPGREAMPRISASR